MNDYKVILIPSPANATPSSALPMGHGVASHFQGCAVGLHIRPDATAALPLVGEGMSGTMVEEMLEVANRQADERAAQAKALFFAAARPDTATEWRDLSGREEELVARHARLADLLVMQKPTSSMDIAAMLTLNAALMESGKPVLLCPHDGGPPDHSLGTVLPRRIAIAWNGSLESSRAVTAALPFLHHAEDILILSAADLAAPHLGADNLLDYLAKRGLAGRSVPLKNNHNAGQHILDECRAQACDLLVMGAYSHSRLRQLIWGGVTRHMLDHAQILCLMSH